MYGLGIYISISCISLYQYICIVVALLRCTESKERFFLLGFLRVLRHMPQNLQKIGLFGAGLCRSGQVPQSIDFMVLIVRRFQWMICGFYVEKISDPFNPFIAWLSQFLPFFLFRFEARGLHHARQLLGASRKLRMISQHLFMPRGTQPVFGTQNL